MDAGVESDVLKEIKRSLKSTSWVSQIPIIYHLHEALKPALGDRLAATARNGSVRQFTATHVRARQARAAGETNNNKDIYQRLVDVHTAKPEQFGLDDVVSMSATNVFAGSDTTAVSLRAMMYFLLKHPECKAKLVKEVDSFFESSSTGDGSEVVTFSAANNMPYLQAVMYEALRLHPVVGQTLPRVAPQEGLQAGNHFIPQGVSKEEIHQLVVNETVTPRQTASIDASCSIDNRRRVSVRHGPAQGHLWRRRRRVPPREVAGRPYW